MLRRLHSSLEAVPGHTLYAHSVHAFLHSVRRSWQFLLWSLVAFTVHRHGSSFSFVCVHCMGLLQASEPGIPVAVSSTLLCADLFLLVIAVALARLGHLYLPHRAYVSALLHPLRHPAYTLRQFCLFGKTFGPASRCIVLVSFYGLHLAASCACSFLLVAPVDAVCVLCVAAIGAWACVVGPLFVRASGERARCCLAPASCSMICRRRRL